ncbi:MAG: hypothetical protein JWO12_918 [Frankiales bacterium]|nr:hypothetical protein [Frankiales bacterium]
MTERKPSSMSWETWVDRQFREARERGELDDLPGFGKPLPGVGEEWDELWWVKQKLARENVSYTPPGLQLRKDVEEALEGLPSIPTEAKARQVLEALNVRIVDSNRMAHDGPPANLMPLDVERFVAIWRNHQPEPAREPEPELATRAEAGRAWYAWRRRRGSR